MEGPGASQLFAGHSLEVPGVSSQSEPEAGPGWPMRSPEPLIAWLELPPSPRVQLSCSRQQTQPVASMVTEVIMGIGAWI